MPSTYTLNNGIELIGTGEQSGTWGDTTNTNFELIDTALDGQVTVTLASAGTSGAPNTLPISDGSSSDGRNRMVIFDDGGDLGATAYVQLTPNDAEKIVYIRNALSGSRSIIVFQGTYSASNDYEIPAGTTAVIYFNGGGAGAVAANVFNNAYFDSLRLGSVSVTAILDEDNMASDSATALATQQSIKAYVDAQVAANNELSEVLANGNTTGGTDIVVSSGDQITTNTISETTAAAGVTIDGVLLKDNGITATGGGSLTGTWSNLGSVTTVDINGGTIDGVTIGGSSAGAITGTTIAGSSATISGDLTVDTNTLHVDSANNRVGVGTTSPASALDVVGTVTADGLTVDAGASDATITIDAGTAGVTSADAKLQLIGSFSGSGVAGYGNIYLDVPSGGKSDMYFQTAASGGSGGQANRMKIDGNGDISFYEDTGTTPKFFWDASAERLGLGTTSPDVNLDIEGINSPQIRVTDTGGSVTTKLMADTVRGYVGTQTNVNFSILTNNTVRATFDTSGNVGIGTGSPSAPLDIEHGTDGQGINVSLFSTTQSNGPVLRLAHSLSDTVGTQTAVTVNDTLGKILFAGSDGSSFYDGAAIIADASQTFTGTAGGTRLEFYTTDSGTQTLDQRMVIDQDGSVGIGTDSPNNRLAVRNSIADTTSSKSSNSIFSITNENSTSTAASMMTMRSHQGDTVRERAILEAGLEGTSGGYLGFWTRPSGAAISEKMRIDADGNVGIGTSSPDSLLELEASAGARLRFTDTGTQSYTIGNAGTSFSIYNESQSSEAARIDASGNLLVGKTSADGGVNGFEARSAGETYITATSATPLAVNRKTSDGALISFSKDGAPVGSIGTSGGSVTVGNADTGLLFNASGDNIYPWNMTTGGIRDAAIDLGKSNTRFKDLYLSGGVYLGGTGAANLLDDYETGTWTPVIQGSTTAGTGTYTLQDGNYIKIGQLVYFQLYLDWTAHTGTGNLNHSLPFTVNNTGINYPPCSAHTVNIALSADHYSCNSVLNEADYGQLKQYPVGGGGQSNVPMDTSGTLLVSGTYYTG